MYTVPQTTPSTGPTILLVIAISGYTVFCYYIRLLEVPLHIYTIHINSGKAESFFKLGVGYYALCIMYHLHVVSVRRDVDTVVSQAFPSSSF